MTQTANLITIYRDGQPIQLTQEQYDARSKANADEKARTLTLVAHYQTRGGATVYKAWSYTFEGQQAYDYKEEVRNNKGGMGGGGCMTEEQFALTLARHLYFARRAGTNLQPVVAFEPAEALLREAK